MDGPPHRRSLQAAGISAIDLARQCPRVVRRIDAMPSPAPLQAFAWIATHPWLYPVLEAVHIVGIALLLGSLVLVETAPAVVSKGSRRRPGGERDEQVSALHGRSSLVRRRRSSVRIE